MKRIGLVAMVLLWATPNPAQQPDVRVRLLTLYRLREVAVRPAPGTRMALDLDSSRRTVDTEFAARAEANSVEIFGRKTRVLRLNGHFRISGDRTSAEAIGGAAEISAHGDELLIVASLPVEQYVADVLEGETSGNMPGQALEAMAVAIPSYTARFRERHEEVGFDFCDTTHCQFLRHRLSKVIARFDRGLDTAPLEHARSFRCDLHEVVGLLVLLDLEAAGDEPFRQAD
jgi:Stage II sporulation protein